MKKPILYLIIAILIFAIGGFCEKNRHGDPIDDYIDINSLFEPDGRINTNLSGISERNENIGKGIDTLSEGIRYHNTTVERSVKRLELLNGRFEDCLRNSARQDSKISDTL